MEMSEKVEMLEKLAAAANVAVGLIAVMGG